MRRLALLLAMLACAIAAAPANADDNVFRQVPGNPADRLAKLPIDDYSYDTATKCLKSVPRGMKAFEQWMEGHAGGLSWGIMRCEKWGKDSASLHAEGRALDWHLDVHDRGDRREAERLIELMLAPDRAGNVHALARRMGIQEIIWNCHSWWAGAEGMGNYSVCFTERGNGART